MDDTVFGRRYRATEKIGSGGMADVFKAVDDVLGRTVAVKVLHAQYATDPAFVARFRQEAQAAANLSHPGIVNIYDWGQDDDTYYIVMEYVRGTDLKALVTEKGPIDPVKAAEYGAQVAAALSVAHGYDIIHRDIKPHNIVLTPDGSIKVMDFGIARAGNTQMTQTGSVLGTAHYVSPEQAQGRPLDPRTDLYSLGVVLYELVTGRVPFEGDSPVAVALKQVNEDAVPPRQINPNIPPSLEAVIMRAMAKNPADRYASAEEMRRDLQRVSSGRMVEAMPPADHTSVMPAVESSSPRVRSVPQKRKVWPWIVAVALLIVIGLGAAWAFGLFDTVQKVVVPDVIGLSQEDATAALEAVELVVGDVETKYSEEPSGTVVSQFPEPQIELEVGAAVDLSISAGQETFAIPDFSGMTETDAIAAVRQAGFEIDTIQREYNKEVADGSVIRQTPEPATQVVAGTRVTLVVSKGTELKQVPSIAGQTQGEAKTELEAAGFVVKITEEPSDKVVVGNVIRQSPEGGVSVEAGNTVTIFVSTGPDLVEVPGVNGETEPDAKKILEDAGFLVLVNYQDSPDDTDGLVLTQNPLPGAQAKAGDTITIWVGKAAAP